MQPVHQAHRVLLSSATPSSRPKIAVPSFRVAVDCNLNGAVLLWRPPEQR